MPQRVYTIDEVLITLTMPGGAEEEFLLERPMVFEFGFNKVPIRADYNDGRKQMQRGYYIYQLMARYSYEAHDMDLKQLLFARSIELKFPPVFGDVEQYQTANVLFRPDSVPDNWFDGLVIGAAGGDHAVIPQGDARLDFEGVQPYNEAEAMAFHWKQSESEFNL